MFAAIPYETFPKIVLGPISLRTFGLMVGLGVLVGAWIAARQLEKYGVTREETYRLATWLVLAGVIGARVTWDLTHLNQINTPLDLIAVWQGGLQFSGGFIAAVAVAYPTFKRWTSQTRWRAVDAYIYGLTAGLAIGRIGCYSVGEHFGWTSNFFLAVRFEGGSTREPAAGSLPPPIGATFINTALLELLYLVVLFLVLTWLARRNAPAGTLIGVFCLYYGVLRFGSDIMRINDDTVLGLTGAQYMCILLALVAFPWIWFRVRPRLARDAEQPPPFSTLSDPDSGTLSVENASGSADTESADTDSADTDAADVETDSADVET